MTDDEILRGIFARYHGRMDDPAIAEPDQRAQLALDLGYLIGHAMRPAVPVAALRALLEEWQEGWWPVTDLRHDRLIAGFMRKLAALCDRSEQEQHET